MKLFFRRMLLILLTTVLICGLLPNHTVFAAGYTDGYAGGKNGDGNGILAKGIDISSWQGDSVDFNKIKSAGYSFVILRAGFATTIDNTFENNYSKAKAAGMDVGVYLYSYADNAQEAKDEAAALRSWLSGKKLEYPVYYDLEEPKIHGLMTKDQLTEIAMTFMDAMAADGWLVGLYSCRSWLESKLDTAKICARYECWLAQYLYSGTCDTYSDYDTMCGMWQYSSSGSVDGVPGNTDMDVCFKDYPTICKRYGFNGYSATGATLVLSGSAAPSVLKLGDSMNISGTITSSSGNLSNVTVGFFDEEGKQVIGKSAGPKAATYDISKLADGVKSKDLPEGSYYYRVLATNTFETQVLLNQSVVVSKNGIRSDHVAIPENLKEGDAFKTTGILTATENISNVTVSVKTSDKIVLSESATPNSVKFDLAVFAEKMKFESLSTGKYTYVVSATLAQGSAIQVVSEAFTVWVKSDPITVTDLSLKKEYYPGDIVALSGKIASSNSDMQVCTLTILDHKGDQVAAAGITSPAKTVDIEELCKSITLDTLEVGAYSCAIEAQNAAGPQKVIEQMFFIRPDAISLCECNAPTCVEKGETFQLEGIITSDATALEFVSVSVIDVNGKVHLSAGDVPDGKVYDLSNLNDQLVFSRLMLNDYTLRICARNAHEFTTVYEAQLSVSDDTDRISWVGSSFNPEGITVYPGSALEIDGTLNSDESDIVSVSAKIYSTENENPLASVHLNTSGKTVSVSDLNQMLRFTALAAGEYRFVLNAENASGQFTMSDSTFFVSDCPHENTANGAKYEPTCCSAGGICADRCLDCGATVRGGQIIKRVAHAYQDGVCSSCGRHEFITIEARNTQQIPERGSRIVLAVSDGSGWYALGSDGSPVEIEAPDATGRISVSAELLWAPEFQRDGSVILRNPYGRLLHFDRHGIQVATGISHTGLEFNLFGQDIQISSKENEEYCLAFSNGVFEISHDVFGVSAFLYVP